MKQLFEVHSGHPVRDLNLPSFPEAHKYSIPLLLTQSIKMIRNSVNAINEYLIERNIDHKE
jgi:hypothetical protein